VANPLEWDPQSDASVGNQAPASRRESPRDREKGNAFDPMRQVGGRGKLDVLKGSVVRSIQDGQVVGKYGAGVKRRHYSWCALVIIGVACAGVRPKSGDPSVNHLIDIYVSVFNGAEDVLLNDILDPHFQRHGDPLSESAIGVPAIKALVRKMRLDMPDLTVELVNALYAKNGAAIQWRMSGTDSGPGDHSPTGRHAEATGMSFFAARDGKLVSEFTIVDGISLLSQLGFRIEPPQSSR
jgi:SnoaL-like polyketide cyclase